MLNDHHIDVIVLSETRLDRTISDSEVSISGYNIFRKDRNLIRGGVAIYVKASLPEPTVRIKSENLELILFEIAPKHAKPFLVVRCTGPIVKQAYINSELFPCIDKFKMK